MIEGVLTAIGTAFILFCGTFFLAPLALVLREKILWWYIHKYQTNEEFWHNVDRYVAAHCYHRHHFNHQTEYKWAKGKGNSYFIHNDDEPIVVSEKQFWYYKKERNESAEKLETLEAPVDKVVNTFKLLLRHFKHEEVNGLEKTINRLIEKGDSELADKVPMLQSFLESTGESCTYSDKHIDLIEENNRKAEELLG